MPRVSPNMSAASTMLSALESAPILSGSGQLAWRCGSSIVVPLPVVREAHYSALSGGWSSRSVHRSLFLAMYDRRLAWSSHFLVLAEV
jgi:hypothetical protein